MHTFTIGPVTAFLITLLGLFLFMFGFSYMRFSSLCGAGESSVECFRSWISLLSPIAASVAVLVAVWQYGLTREISERTLRAYIGVADGIIQVISQTNDQHLVVVKVRLKNFGSSPAHGFTTWFAMPTIDEPAAEPFTAALPLDQRNGSSIVFPSADVFVERIISATAQQIGDLRAGTSNLFIWGGVDYTDTYGNSRSTLFHATNSSEQQAGVFALKPHRRGYQAD